MTGSFDRIRQRTQDLLARSQARQLGEILSQGLAGHGHAAAIDKACLEQEFQHRRNSADFVQVFHHVLTARFQIGQEGHAIADRLEVIDREFDAD